VGKVFAAIDKVGVLMIFWSTEAWNRHSKAAAQSRPIESQPLAILDLFGTIDCDES